MSLVDAAKQKTQKQVLIDDLKKVGESLEIKRLNVNLPAKLMRDFKVQATLDGLKINELTIQLINEYLMKRRNEEMSK